ncbi:MAG TPA: hypothetical protein VNB90_17140 [Cytophagaceae bacterium]|nr:hypothetical protein [Cytophagaceae bacterium]
MRKIDFIFHIGMIVILALLLACSYSAWRGLILVVQLFVGLFQLFSTTCRTLEYRSFDNAIQKLIRIYWISVAFYALGWIPVLYLHNFDLGFAYLFSAWIIAFYYCYITYRMAYSNTLYPENKN